jgi:hypothetical protein
MSLIDVFNIVVTGSARRCAEAAVVRIDGMVAAIGEAWISLAGWRR